MSTFIVIISFLALFHFIYELIVLPSIRLHLRNQLFSLRDDIRHLKINGLEKKDEQAFWFVHDGINIFLTKIPKITFLKLIKFKEAHDKDPSFLKEAEMRISVVKNSSNEAIISIFRSTSDILVKAVIANMGAWFFYLVPIFVLTVFMRQLSKSISGLIVISQEEAVKIFPKERLRIWSSGC